MTYEQDWLAGYAQPNFNLTDPEKYLDLMANSMAAAGLTVQYCGQMVGQVLQGSKYGNLTTARVSGDGFNPTHWDSFLYNSRLTSAVGIFPFSDNVYSSDVMSLILATQSAGMVGMADAIGSEVAANVLQVIRPDGIIVKPDAPMVPLDSTYIADAQAALTQAAPPPMVAYSNSDHGELRTAYVFAYSRAANGGSAAISFTPEQVGIQGAAYVYNYFAQRGQWISAGAAYTDSTPATGSYYVVAPAGPSGIALVGDSQRFVSAGAQRIGRMEDNGSLTTSVHFASGESGVTIWGYSPSAPTANMLEGSLIQMSYDAPSGVFTLTLAPAQGSQTAALTLSR